MNRNQASNAAKALAVLAAVLVATGCASLHPNRSSSVALPDTPSRLTDLASRVDDPSEIDAASEGLGIPPSLVNFHLATPADLSSFDIGIGEAVHIPVAIADRKGGRKSLYFLQPGEEALAGLFVTHDGLALRYVRRESGEGVPARTGDLYSFRITTRDGRTLFTDRGSLRVIDAAKGMGEITTEKNKTDVWILWSCIRIRHESEK